MRHKGPLIRALELVLALSLRLARLVLIAVTSKPNLGPFRYVVSAAVAYVLFALILVYAVAPLRASAVNKPIILLPGSDRLNEVRLDRWRYIAEVRARICAERLIADQAEPPVRACRGPPAASA